ncbi:hypothetical protein KGQ72_01815 [Patescibacteria group bacterium]|nr:hypothetical protein [Patescibacteria group bacterium]
MKKLSSLLPLLSILVSVPALADGDDYLSLYRVKGLSFGLSIRSEQYRFGGQAQTPVWMTIPTDEKAKVSVFGTVGNYANAWNLKSLTTRTLQLSDQFSVGSVPGNPLKGHGAGITYRLDRNTTFSGAFSYDHDTGRGEALLFRKVF